ncbi:MAG TPA: NADH-ubiquinone oxidoreductase-F iron-sulfur binding region domain-containing protein [Thermodesulfobacteriota bacterium]|nr:NADH-ubiquinone oxidoreductase-F iron-sulfur binding region domain-containing protein [Thermodesulfobacteriota bacterium]
MSKIEKIKGYAADCYLHEGPAIRLMEAAKYQDFLSRQKREVMKRCGSVNPEDIEAYIQNGGFNALKRAVTAMTPEKVIEQVKQAELRDRSPQARKTSLDWESYGRVRHLPRYVVATRLGGPSEAWMERTLIEGDPFALIEGMAITAYALGGVSKGIIYIPTAYKPLAFRRMDRAIKAAETHRYLGRDILGTSFSFDIEIREVAGEDSQPQEHNPFVCGECGRALFDFEGAAKYENFQNIEAWPKPFYVNNVETYLNIPLILNKGVDAFASLGPKDARGTKIFALTGKTKHPCLVEAPIGSTLMDLLKIADGDSGGSGLDGELKAFQVGGPAGGIFPARFQTTPMDFDSLAKIGWKIGSGHIVLLDEKVCIVEMTRYSLNQLVSETCDRCSSCGKALKNILSILTRLTKGMGESGDIETLESFASQIQSKARCEFGRTAVDTILTGLRYFRAEYESHLKQSCPAHYCKELTSTTERPLKLAA